MKIKFEKQQSFRPPIPKALGEHPLGSLYWSDIHTGKALTANRMSKQQIKEALEYMQNYQDESKDWVSTTSWISMFQKTLSYLDRLEKHNAQHKS